MLLVVRPGAPSSVLAAHNKIIITICYDCKIQKGHIEPFVSETRKQKPLETLVSLDTCETLEPLHMTDLARVLMFGCPGSRERRTKPFLSMGVWPSKPGMYTVRLSPENRTCHDKDRLSIPNHPSKYRCIYGEPSLHSTQTNSTDNCFSRQHLPRSPQKVDTSRG